MQRLVEERYTYTFADGTYFTVIYNGEGYKMPVLTVVGISTAGQRDMLAVAVGDRENEHAWKDLFDDLKARGVKEIGFWVSDGNQAKLNAITAKFGTTPRQRCVLHKMDNVLSYIPHKQQERIKPELRALFYQKDRQATSGSSRFQQAIPICLSQCD